MGCPKRQNKKHFEKLTWPGRGRDGCSNASPNVSRSTLKLATTADGKRQTDVDGVCEQSGRDGSKRRRERERDKAMLPADADRHGGNIKASTMSDGRAEVCENTRVPQSPRTEYFWRKKPQSSPRWHASLITPCAATTCTCGFDDKSTGVLDCDEPIAKTRRPAPKPAKQTCAFPESRCHPKLNLESRRNQKAPLRKTLQGCPNNTYLGKLPVTNIQLLERKMRRENTEVVGARLKEVGVLTMPKLSKFGPSFAPSRRGGRGAQNQKCPNLEMLPRVQK